MVIGVSKVGGVILGNRSIIYIDGFNFYYGVMKNSSDKWLNLEHYFRLLRQDDDIQKIYYFTAEVSGNAKVRQETYFQALQTLKLVQIIFGLYKTRQRKCKVRSCSNLQKNYTDYEEKRTDVNIALQMLDDAYQNNCDRMIVVSGDSDLVPAVELVRKRFSQIQISVYIPSRHPKRGAATELRNSANKNKTLPTALFLKTQFPDSLVNNSGKTINKPSSW